MPTPRRRMPFQRALKRRTPRRFNLGILILIMLAQFCAGAASADSLALMSGAGQQGLGGSASAQPIVVAVRNVDGAVVAGRTINWTTSNGFVLSTASSVTDANGLASVNFTYGNYGTTNVVATDSVGATSATAMETSTGSDSITLISGDRQAGKSGTVSAQPLVVEIRNAVGNPIAGRTVNWSDLTTYTQVVASSSVTDAGGHASMNFTYLQGPPALGGAVGTIRATNSASPSMQSVDASMNVLGFDHLQLLSVQSQSGLIGTIGTPIVVQVVDGAGTPIPGATVTWAERVANGFVSLSSASTVTDAAGKTSITFQYLAQATGDIEATYGVSQADMTFSGVDGGSVTFISPTNIFGASGSVSPAPMVVEKRGADNAVQSGRTVTWTVLSGDAVLNAPTSVTDGVGRASMGFTYGTVESRVRASVGPYGDATFLPVASQNSLRMVSGESQAGTVNTPGAQPIVVELLNAAGTPVVGAIINWTSDPQITLAAASSITDASGRASVNFTFGPVGRWQIRADDPTVGAGRGPRTYVSAVGINTMTVISGDSQSGLVGTHSAQPLVAELRDASGNPIVGTTISWVVNGGNLVLDATSSVTDAAGRASMGFTYGSSASFNGLEADDPTTAARAGFHATGVGANAISQISGNGQSGVDGAPGAQPLVIEVRDAAGNPVAGRTINWTSPVGNAAPNAPSSVTNAAGRASMSFTYGPNDTSTITATDSVSGQQVLFTLNRIKTNGTAQFISGNGQTGLPGTAGAQPIVLELRDQNNQPDVGKPIAWTVVSGTATLGTVSTTTDTLGRASATFNFGPTAGTSIIQAADTGPNPGLIQATVTALGANQNLSVVSGDSQVLVGTTPSDPLVVQLKNVSNAPVVGATINWTATNGTLSAATSVTDASGHASNTVTATTAGAAVTVQANSTLAAGPVSFNLSTGLANLPALTPEEHAVAGALDTACPALASAGTLTPEQADLLARCREITAAAGINGGATADALEQLVTQSAEVQSNAAVTASVAQFQNINLRLAALRSSSNTSSLANTSSLGGLSFAGPGGVLPLGSLMGVMLGEADTKKPEVGAGFSRWGFFATGTIGRGTADARSTTPAYSYDINGLTAGVDYRQRDNWVSGVAVGFSRQSTNLADDRGDVTLRGWSISSYSTWSFKNNLYVDGVVTWGSNQFDMNRKIDYTLPVPGGGTTSIHQIASGQPGGNVFSAALTFGGDFHKQEWNFSPYLQLASSRMSFDSYQEKLLAGSGSGLGLTVDARTVNTLSSVLGTKVSWTHSVDWGVFIPTASLEWQHEYKSDLQAITARFTNDPTQASFSLTGVPLDNSFFRVGLGFSVVLPRGRSGFMLFEHMLGRDGMTQDNLGLGIRIEF